jgi:hypothetical protein
MGRGLCTTTTTTTMYEKEATTTTKQCDNNGSKKFNPYIIYLKIGYCVDNSLVL